MWNIVHRLCKQSFTMYENCTVVSWKFQMAMNLFLQKVYWRAENNKSLLGKIENGEDVHLEVLKRLCDRIRPVRSENGAVKDYFSVAWQCVFIHGSKTNVNVTADIKRIPKERFQFPVVV